MRVLTALIRYRAALLLRSHRWLPPLVLYAALLAVGVQPGQPVLDALGFAAAALLPSAAWLVRVCVHAEPPAARDCAAAAAGGARAHLAGLLTALGASAVLGTVATGVVLLVGGAHATDRVTAVAWPAAAGAGLLAVLACALLGTAAGALANRPLLRGTAGSVSVTTAAAVALLVVGASPANAAVSSLVTASREGRTIWPLAPFGYAAAVAAVALAVASRVAARRR